MAVLVGSSTAYRTEHYGENPVVPFVGVGVVGAVQLGQGHALGVEDEGVDVRAQPLVLALQVAHQPGLVAVLRALAMSTALFVWVRSANTSTLMQELLEAKASPTTINPCLTEKIWNSSSTYCIVMRLMAAAVLLSLFGSLSLCMCVCVFVCACVCVCM